MDALTEVIIRRGPDFQNSERIRLANGIGLHLLASVLSLRGDGVTRQPLLSPNGRFVLAWNGQVFDCLKGGTLTSLSRQLAYGNDGALLFGSFLTALNQGVEDVGELWARVLSELEGPFASVLIDKRESMIYLARDPLGRRSLLFHRPELGPLKPGILVASASHHRCFPDGLKLEELSCEGVCALSAETSTTRQISRISELTSHLVLCELRSNVPATCPPMTPATIDERQTASAAFQSVLSQSVSERVTSVKAERISPSQTHVAVLFSGGLDCTVIALMASLHIPPEQPIDLLNVAFENPRALAAAAALKKGHAKSTVLEDDTAYAVPDRILGFRSYQELCRLHPSRRWRFVQINVPHNEYCEHRPEIAALMHPSESVMDLSIGAALYFASRGTGLALEDSPDDEIDCAKGTTTQNYSTPAPVLLSGLGADELLGGYSRHRRAFEKGGKDSLVAELQLDLDRLPVRNLGRDDRILSNFGREARYPYLSRAVLSHLVSLPVELKMDLSRPDGEGGDKLILRNIALSLGLKTAAGAKKKAIQFGSRSAKMGMEDGRVKGHEALSSTKGRK